MIEVKVEITRYISDDQPGWVECRLNDAYGHEWTFHEKVPVVSDEELDNKTVYPRSGGIGCQITNKWHDKNGREIITITTTEPWDIETIDEKTSFDVLPEQITEI